MIFVISLAIAVCAQSIFLIRSEWRSQPPKATGDGMQYENIAFHLSQGRGYYFNNGDSQWRSLYEQATRTGEGNNYKTHLAAPIRDMPATDRPPLYPTILASTYTLLGRDATAFTLIHWFSGFCLALAAALSACLVAQLARASLVKDKQRSKSQCVVVLVASLLPVVLFLSNRTLQSYTEDFLTEPLALVWMQLVAISLVRSSSMATARSKWMHLLFAAFCWGCLILTRSLFVTWLPALLMLLLALPAESWRRRLQHSLAFLGVVCLVCAPWWARNIFVHERFIPLGTQGPIAMLGGYCEAAWQDGGEWQYEAEKALRAQLDADPDFHSLTSDLAKEAQVYDAARAELVRFVGGHYDDLPRIALARIVTHWNPYYGKSLIWKIAILCGAAMLVRRWWIHRKQPSKGKCYFTAISVLIGMPLISTVMVGCLYSVGGRFLVPCFGILNTLVGLAVLLAMHPNAMADVNVPTEEKNSSSAATQSG